MCGIAGFQLAPGERVNARRLAGALLLNIDSRGGHATGAAFFDEGQAWIQKSPVRAPAFVEALDMGAGTRTAILHTRFATQGSVEVWGNNHPIEIPGEIIGVHNGIIYNDDDLFRQVGVEKRLAEVDSEAVFAALAYLDAPVTDTLARVRGSAAIGWIEPCGAQDVLHVARVESSPLVYAFTPGGSFVFASTAGALRNALRAVGLRMDGDPVDAPEGTYLRVQGGTIVDWQHIMREYRQHRHFTVVERQALALD